MAKKIYGHDPKHYPRPHREFVDIDYWHKLSTPEKAWRARVEQNRTGGRFLKDGFDADGHDDTVRRAYMVDNNHRRSDVATAIKCGIPADSASGVDDSTDRYGVIVRYGAYGAQAGYTFNGINLEEDAMIAAIDAKYGHNEDDDVE